MEKLIIYAAVGYPRQTANPVLPAVPRTWDELVDAADQALRADAPNAKAD